MMMNLDRAESRREASLGILLAIRVNSAYTDELMAR